MTPRLMLLLIAFLILAGAGGYLIGHVLQAPGEILSAVRGQSAHDQRAPMLVSPETGSEFVASDIALQWSWQPGLEPNQRYALKVRTDAKPYQEVWTVETRVPAQALIDRFNLDYGSYYWQVAVVNVDADGVYASLGSDWSDIHELRRLRRERLPAKPYAEMSAAAKSFYDRGLGAAELIDAVHLFVHQNSANHEQLAYSPDYSDAVDLMHRHATGQTAEMPLLLCDGRSTAMLTLLGELGIESRLVFLYADAPGWIAEHTVLEVFNPDSQYWQTHDLAWDVYYIAADSGIRVNAESILFDASLELLGCPIAGGACAAELAQPGLAYFEALRYGHHAMEVLVNPDRSDLSARFAGKGNRNLAEFIGGGDSRRVAFRMDSWREPQ